MSGSGASSSLGLLHALLRGDHLGEVAPDDAQEVLALAGAHGLEAHLDDAAEEGRVALPDETRHELHERARLRDARALHALHVRDMAVETLAAARVPVLVLKGAAFADWLYLRPGLRAFEDVDLLVPRTAWRDALAALVAAGGRAGRPSTAGPLVRPVTLAGGLVVDLHARFADAPGRAGLDDEPVFERALEPGAPAGPRVPTLSVADHLLHVAEHAARSKWVRLGWLADVHRLLERVTTGNAWLDDVRATASRLGRGRMLDLALVLLARAHGQDGPEPADIASLVAACEANQMAPGEVDAHGFDAAWFARLVDEPREAARARRDRWLRGLRRRALRVLGR